MKLRAPLSALSWKLAQAAIAVTIFAGSTVEGVLAAERDPGDVRASTDISIDTSKLPDGFFTYPSTLISSLINIAFVIAVILVFFYLIWGGIEWITSGGDKGKTESARNKITAAVIGLIVLAASYAILTLVLRLLGYDDLNDALTPST